MALVSPEMEAAKHAGRELFDALFDAEVRDLYRRTETATIDQAKRLLIMLDLTSTPELEAIPWEYLYDDGRFLATSVRTQIVRFVPVERTRPPQQLELPLRVLAVAASPNDLPPLDAQGLEQRLRAALGNELRDGLVELTWLESGTVTALRESLKRRAVHALHFFGHCVYDERSGANNLLFEDENGRARGVPANLLGSLLADVPTIRLAVLNAGEGARARLENAFGGVAAELVRSGLSAVVATQFEMPDDAATLLAKSLYSTLAEGYPIDSAIAEARKAIWADYDDTAWGRPMLFMGARDGRLFDVRAS